MTKLIEVALPLQEINRECAREKSIRQGHPSTMHTWWARRPLAACRAILFAQFVDDPSSVLDEFPDEASQEHERQRLFRIIKNLVRWEHSDNEQVIYDAKREIARSIARAQGDEAPKTQKQIDLYLNKKAPPLVDPFCGGGSIPLEAQRLGLRAHGSDLNPVAVLITKAMVETPPKFAGKAPINPRTQGDLEKGAAWGGKRAQGLAVDVRYYGKWMRNEAHRRIGHLYPTIALADGKDANVIAWLWTRTVRCPNPVCGAEMPLIRSFNISKKKGGLACVKPFVDRSTVPPTVCFNVESGNTKSMEKTVSRTSARCICCESVVPLKYVRTEAQNGRMSARLMAVVGEGTRRREFLSPTSSVENVAEVANPEWAPNQAIPTANHDVDRLPMYGMMTWGEAFTKRQLVALTTFSDLVGEVRERILSDARESGLKDDGVSLNAGGTGAQAYADAVSTYLAFAVDRSANYWSSLTPWSGDFIVQTFGRQAIPMVWDYAEANPFSSSTGNWDGAVSWIAKVLEFSIPACGVGRVRQLDAVKGVDDVGTACFCTDPPYYDNIGYADLSDFFYVWIRRSIGRLYPDLFRTILTPKAGELVATPYRFGGNRETARKFFETGLSRATANMRAAQGIDYPMTMIYAYKQAETKSDGHGEGSTASTGWETMLSGIIDGGFVITGTWPLRTERDQGLKSGTNVLASSIVLACRPRSESAKVCTRRNFTAVLKRELPPAVRRLQQENIAPVDLAQAAIGPGMAVYSRYSMVLEADGSALSVRSALVEINRVLDETLAQQEGDMDLDTRFCVAWFEQYGTSERAYGEAEVLFTAKNTSFEGLQRAGVISGGRGKVRLKRRNELDLKWNPLTDERIADWECVQHLVRAMTAEDGGGIAEAARLFGAMGAGRAANARALAYRLYTVCERKGWTEEALAYNILVTSWAPIQAEAAKVGSGGPAQSEFAL